MDQASFPTLSCQGKALSSWSREQSIWLAVAGHRITMTVDYGGNSSFCECGIWDASGMGVASECRKWQGAVQEVAGG